MRKLAREGEDEEQRVSCCFWSTLLACCKLLVSADEQKKKRTSEKMAGRGKGGACKHPSKYLNPPLPSPLHENPFLVSKCKISKRQIVGVGWFHMLSLCAHKGKLLT